MKNYLASHAKALLAFVGAATPAGVVGVLALAHVHIDLETAAYILGVASPVVSFVLTHLGPANQIVAPLTPAGMAATWDVPEATAAPKTEVPAPPVA